MLNVSHAEARALVAGEIVVAFAERGAATEGDEVDIEPTHGIDIDTIKPAYRRWVDLPMPPGPWKGVIESVDPATILDPDAGLSRHIRTATASGDLVVVRVYGPDGPVLTDAAFDARRKSVEGALRT